MTDETPGTDDPAGVPRRFGPFRLWEVVVIAIAIVLFAAAAFAGPAGDPGTVPSPDAASSPSPAPSAPTPTASLPPPGERPTTKGPVSLVDEILPEEVGDYRLADRGLSEAGAQAGAVDAAELRYSLDPGDAATDMLHGIEVHRDGPTATARVRSFRETLAASGWETAREQPLRNTEGEAQGYFIALRQDGSQRLLLWSNRNVMFSLGGGSEADVDAFFEALPY